MKKLHLLAALLTAGFISCATVSCGETKPSDTESGQTDNGGNGGSGTTLPEGQISIAKALEIGRKITGDQPTEELYTLQGTVKSFDGSHKSFTLTDGNNDIYVFIFDNDYNALPADKKYDLNDTVVLKGPIQNRNSNIEISKPKIISVTKSGSTGPSEGGDTEQGGGDTNTDTLELITVERALTIASEHTDDNVSKEYKCKGIASNVDKTKGKTQFDLTQDGHTILVYYILNTDKLANLNNNDEVTIKGPLKSHGKTKEFYKATILEIGGSSSGTPDAGDTEQGGGSSTNTPSLDNLEGTISVSEAITIIEKLPLNEMSSTSYYIRGKASGKLNAEKGICDLVDTENSDKKILLWGDKNKFSKNKYAINDTILVYGKVKRFKESDGKTITLKVDKPDIIDVKKAA